MNFLMFKLVLEKAEEPENKLSTSAGFEKAREFQKNSYFCFIDYAKAFDCVWITINCGKFWKRWEHQTTWLASWEICMQVKKQQLELGMEQQTGSKSGKEYVNAVYCHPAYLTYMQSTSWEMPGWMKHKMESRLPEKISMPKTCRWHHPDGRNWRRNKEPLDESERGEWKSWLKAQHSEN